MDKYPMDWLAGWDGKPFRIPDIWEEAYPYYARAIWYGPGGEDGDSATEVEHDSDFFEVSEYTNIEGYFDEPPEGNILKTSTQIHITNLKATLKQMGIKPIDYSGLLALCRYAAAIGVANLQYYGGEEEFVDELPR